MKKKYISLVVLILLAVLLSSQVTALGVMPSSKRILIGESQSYQLKITNNDKMDFTAYLDVQGDLSDYVILSEEKIEFSKSDDIKRVTVTLNIPDGASLPEGDHENYIIIRQEVKQTQDVEATVSLAHKLTISKPFSAEALQVKIYATNFKKNTENNFALEVQSVGTKDIPEAIPILEIYSATNDKLDTITGERFSIKPGEKKIIDVKWTPEFPNGKYLAKAYIIYGEKTATFEKIFSIGYPEVLIDSISASAFKLGGIAALDIIISSSWVEPIDNVFANVKLTRDGSTIYSTKTISKRLSSLGKTNLPAFLDTEGLEPGKYALDVNLNYLGTTKDKVFDIFLDQNQIRLTGPTGNVIEDTEGGSGISLLIIIVSILVILNGIVVWKFVIMKKK